MQTHRGARDVPLLEHCLEQLPATMRSLIAAKYTEGRSSEEIAGTFSRNVTWVRVSLFRIRQQLRDCIEGKMGGSHAG